METSSKRQKQKLTLAESHRIARRTLSQFAFLSNSPLKRVSILSVGVVAGLGLPALVVASQQHATQHNPSSQQTSSASTQVNIDTTSSPDSGEVFSTQVEGNTGNSTSDASVTINGHHVPIVDGTVSQQVPTGNGDSLDVQITIDNSSVSSSVSGNSSSSDTDISIHSSSSSDSSVETNLDIRGSPRR